MRRWSRNTGTLGLKRSGHHGDDVGGRAHGPALKIDERMRGLTGGEEFFAPENFVIQMNPQQWFFAQIGDDGEYVVVEGGTGIFGGNLEHRQAVALGLKLTIGEAEFFKQSGAADLKPREIIRVVNNAHHVGLGVANGDLGA